jgi:hypothetical protein
LDLKSSFPYDLFLVIAGPSKMNNKSRITSILKAVSLDTSITGLSTFDLSVLDLPTDFDFTLPSNVRLGHLAEKVVSELIKASANYKLLFENVQIIENKNTIGEIDFIIEEIKTKQIIHLELAYKFYLFDPSLSSQPINNWIGPNRNDSLIQKLGKLKTKQFPLLHHPSAKSAFENIEIEKASKALCLLASLFVPYEYQGHFDSSYEKAIKGYYLNFERFAAIDHPAKAYHIPAKKEWGIEPAENEVWTDFAGVENHIRRSIEEKQATLCWQKLNDGFTSFFIVWW